MARAHVIETLGLTRRFGDVTAVDALDLTVERGEVVGLLGHNGAGKTTTVRLLNGVLAASSGGARVLGLDPWRDGVALRRRTGVATETPAVDERLDDVLRRVGRCEDVHVADRLAPPPERARDLTVLDRLEFLEEGEHVVREGSPFAE